MMIPPTALSLLQQPLGMLMWQLSIMWLFLLQLLLLLLL
jgi:hypothetical protein